MSPRPQYHRLSTSNKQKGARLRSGSYFWWIFFLCKHTPSSFYLTIRKCSPSSNTPPFFTALCLVSLLSQQQSLRLVLEGSTCSGDGHLLCSCWPAAPRFDAPLPTGQTLKGASSHWTCAARCFGEVAVGSWHQESIPCAVLTAQARRCPLQAAPAPCTVP